MHFITGGNFNGKRKWALNFYQLTTQNEELELLSFYKNTAIENISLLEKPVLMLVGLEYFVQEKLARLGIEETTCYFRQLFKELISWEEQEEKRRVIVIGSDITKGIVPIEKENREWRDAVGWIYQEAARNAKRVDVIWYGVNDTLKN
ncbi:bifunctional adenosylcobinamide kinase/adenosylcobinamide-phosphate guanylyltransferase [Niallia sp. NCCP-28]|uniref:bifunctional adenosylcobinamide kinase/adenosylcobinamide-phosphate guanylyltransferase n=1 Tax=Niallia sp. NCCP-28 TaxID=2934712 RepID=UPI00208BBDB6|nr:bifunctional adenosylcobinamide kinase/adenosylcobinamide-phosphate guanylyltransferase [Niallia sp. NCCP-28]GKU84657.1 hypothetical protein NCCP28_40530 [Niallia sp. NCCP-28]